MSCFIPVGLTVAPEGPTGDERDTLGTPQPDVRRMDVIIPNSAIR
jgi:hypothetical protein